MNQISDALLKDTLQKFIIDACTKLGKSHAHYEIKHMGLVNRGQFKKGWYVQVQNFKDVYAVKRSMDDKYIRYTFRTVLLSNEHEPRLMVLKWTPSMGGVEDNENIFQAKLGDKDFEFLRLMVSAIQMPKLDI